MAYPPSAARKLVFAVVIAGIVAASGAGRLLAQSPFSSALERQLWKKLLPMGEDLADDQLPNFVPIPRRVSVNVPSVSRVEVDVDEFDQPIYASVTDPEAMSGATPEIQAEQAFDIEKTLLGADGECTFSHAADYDNAGPQWRQCKAGASMLPPPPGALLDPVGLAVDGSTVYVVDDFNHRVQAFDFDGRVKPMEFPIGNGIPGTGAYSYSSYSPYDGFIPALPSGYGSSGYKLSAPNGIAVDASHNLVIADAGNNRVAVFANNGLPLFDFPLPSHLGFDTKPTLIALTPGATVLPFGSTIPVGRELDRVVVTDWSHCFVHIYKTNFEHVATYPDEAADPSLHENGDGCRGGSTVEEPDGVVTQPGQFSTVTGATVDTAGRIYISDHAQNVVQVFDPMGLHLGWIGKPGMQAAPGELAGPVGVAFDHLGRLGVIDGENSRVVFYSLTFPGGAPVATFEFQLDITVSVEDFPMGLVEQVGPVSEGLDPKGRFLATDPINRRVLRFELPALGILDPTATILATQPHNVHGNRLLGRGTFKVAVPRQKDGTVQDVEVFVVPVEAGVDVVADSITPTNQEVNGVDIPPAQAVSYEFMYLVDDTVTQATFEINARGDLINGDYLANAPQAEARSRANCVGCDARHEVFWFDQDTNPGNAAAITNLVTGSWYPKRVFVRLFPDPADADVTSIAWQYGGVAAVVYPQHADVQETEVSEDGYIDVPAGIAGVSQLTYWAVTSEGAIGPPHVVDLQVDLEPPSAHFLLWPPFTGTLDLSGKRWYNHDVTVGYTVQDEHSGTDANTQVSPGTADGEVVFTDEGRLQSQILVLSDRVNHEGTFNTATASGGRYVYIDKVAPVFTFVPAPITVPATGTDAYGAFAVLPLGSMIATAVDPLLDNGDWGSGVRPIADPIGFQFRAGVNTFTYTATDYAGNTSTASTTVTVVSATPVAITIAHKTKVYGDPNPALTASVTVTVGSVVMPFLGVVNYTLQTTANLASPVGDYPITALLGLNPNLAITVVENTLSITPKAATITANNAQKLVGQVDPPLSATSSGFLTADAIVVTATRAPGNHGIGTYPITPHATGANIGNYIVTAFSGVFTITDNLPPVCGTAYGGEIWPPNHKKFYAAPIRGVVDPEGGAVTLLVTGIWQDEQIDSTGDGNFSPDGQGVGTSTAWVRAERNGHQNSAVGNGRVYEILFTATDNRGAQCTGSVFYTVPHDQGQHSTAIDSGVRYDSTGIVPGARDKWQIHQNSPQP